MPLLAWAVTITCAGFIAAVLSLLGYRDIAWRLRQRRRRRRDQWV